MRRVTNKKLYTVVFADKEMKNLVMRADYFVFAHGFDDLVFFYANNSGGDDIVIGACSLVESVNEVENIII